MRSLFFIALLLPGLSLAEVTPEQAAFIELLKKYDHTYALLQSPNGRITLILGEKHGKPHAEAERERQVAKHFHYAGTEGAFTENYGITGWLLNAHVGKRSKSDNEKGLSGSVLHFLETTLPVTQVKPLEIDHQPDSYEHLYFWSQKGTAVLGWIAAPALIAALGCQVTLDRLALKDKRAGKEEPTRRPRLNLTYNTLLVVGGTTTLGWFGSVLSLLLLQENNKSEDSTVGLIGNRNVTMAKVAADWDQELKDTKSMVVAVGAAHMPGLKRLFEERHGYKALEHHVGKHLRKYLNS